MSVSALGKQLGTCLHQEFLRKSGFRKSGATLYRDCEGYRELYTIQGSSWNSGEEPWEFYLNVGVQLPGVEFAGSKPPTLSSRHAEGRSASCVEVVVTELAALIADCSAALPMLLPPVRARAAAGLWSPLPVPTTWDQSDAR